MTNIINIRNSADSVFKIPSDVIDSNNTYIVYSKTTSKFSRVDRLNLFQDISENYYNFAEVTNSGVLIYQKLLAKKYRDKKPLTSMKPVGNYLERNYPIPFTIRKHIMKETVKC